MNRALASLAVTEVSTGILSMYKLRDVMLTQNVLHHVCHHCAVVLLGAVHGLVLNVSCGHTSVGS